MTIRRPAGFLAMMFLFALPVHAHQFEAGDIAIDHPWTLPLPPVSENGAAYFSIKNRGENTDRLTGGSSPISDRVEIHQHVHENGIMKMQPVTGGLEIGGGELITFQPGGLHLMLIGLKKPLVEGESFPLTLQFELVGEIEIVVNIDQPDHSKGMDEGATEHSGHGSN